MVPDIGQKGSSTRWICTLKDTPKGNIQKALLVALGFEDSERNAIQKDSPTCARESLRAVLAIAAQHHWKL